MPIQKTKGKLKISYNQFLELPDRVCLENAIIQTCKDYFLSGDSMSVATKKTYDDALFKRDVINKVIASDAELNKLRYDKWMEHQTSRAWR